MKERRRTDMITWFDLVRAIERLRPELPLLVGDDWSAFESRLDALLPQLTRNPDREPLVRAQILDLFASYPAAHERLLDVLVELEPGSSTLFERIWQPESARETGAQPASSTVTRYTDITAPSRLGLGRRGVITVGLTCAPSSDSVLANALRLATGMLEVHLQVSPADFEVTGQAIKPLEVLADRDSEPVVFYVTGQSSGVKTLRLDFRQSGMVVGTAALAIEVTASPGVEAPTQELSGAVGFNGASAQPPDLDLRVTVTPRDGGIALGYTLHSPNGAAPHHYQTFSEVTLPGTTSAQAFQSRLRDTLETLQAGADVGGAKLTPAQIEDRLAAIGHEMWESLFPPELRRALVGSWRRVRTLQITTDEPWIPWEMVRPYDASDPDRVIDEFFCEHFQLTRWLAGDGGGAGEITVRRLACVEAGVVPNMAPLRHAPEERQQLLDLATRHGVAVCCPEPPALAAVEALLDDGDFGLWHFVGHGSVDPATPNEAPLALPDGKLRPTAIHGARQERIRRARPLMFLSACRVGGGGWALVGLGGWAAKLVGQARCGAFVAPQWAVDDALAGAFAQAFYDGIEAGQTIGEAAWSARRHVRELAPADPTWLAYSVYAQPNARVIFG
jgi:hypothetical protein